MSIGLLFATSLAVGFSGAITPGTLFVACVTRSARDGFWGGLSTTVGHAILELVTVVGLGLGLGAVLGRPGVAPAISLVGGIVLIWMGYGTARLGLSGDMALPDTEHTGPGDGARHRAGLGGATFTGMAATVTNPYWVVWWATVGLSYLTLAAPLGSLGVGAFYVGHILSDFIWYAAVAAAVAGGRRLLKGRGYSHLLVACGLLLLALGALFAGRGLLTIF